MRRSNSAGYGDAAPGGPPDAAFRTCLLPLNSAQLALRRLGELAERGRIGHREVREDLTIDLDPGELQPVHEAGVGELVLTGGRVDADHPEPAELALPVLAIPVRIAPAP